MEICFIFLGCLIQQITSQMTKCEDVNMQPIVTCCSYIQQCVILQGDQESYQQLQHIDSQIIKKSFIIPQQFEPILIRIIDSLEGNHIQEKLMCFLFLNIEYYITCIDFDLVSYEEQTNYSVRIRLDTQIQSNENCDEMFINKDGSLSLFCLSQYNFKQYNIELLRNVTLIKEIDVLNQIEDRCKKKLYILDENSYFVAFYQCFKWKVIFITKEEVKTIIDTQMQEEDPILSYFSFIDDVIVCQISESHFYFYFVENNSYLQMYLNVNQIKPLHYVQFQISRRIIKLVMQIECKQIILVNILQNSQSTLINSQKINEINLNYNYQKENIHFHSDLLFLQNQFELKVLLDSNLNQTFQIYNTSLHFIEFNNLFCQFDSTKKALQFYKYYPLSAYIIPKQKYLYIIQRTKLFRNDSVVKCLKIIYDKSNNVTQDQKSTQVIWIELKNTCQTQIQTISNSKVLYQSNTPSFKLDNSEGNIKVSIRKDQNVQDSCLSKLRQLHFLGNIEIRKLAKFQYIAFQNETFFFIYDCQKMKLVIQVNKDQFDVPESYGNYYVINKNIVKKISYMDGQIIQFNKKIDGVVISIKQISQSIFLYTNNSKLPIIIYQDYMDNSKGKYLSKSLYQPEPILFYKEFGKIRFIQYSKVLAVENEGKQLRCLQFSQALIISIEFQILLKNYYSIFAIQIITNSLILYYFNDHEIQQISNYSFQNYQFSYPFKYELNYQNIAFLIEQNKQLYIAIFIFGVTSLQLTEIIQTDDSYFTFQQRRLLYSYNKELKILLLEEILFELETEKPYQNSLSLHYQMYKNSKEKDQEGYEVNFIIQNQCYQLYSLLSETIIEIEQGQNLKLQISDFFYGPINNLTLINNSIHLQKEPFQFKQQLNICSPKGSTFCYQQYKIQIENKNLVFKAIFLENKGFQVFISLTDIYYVFWIKQNYYIFLKPEHYYLFIHFIQCSEQEDSSCKIIKNLNDNQKIQQFKVNDIFRTGNLIGLINQVDQTFIYFKDLNFTVIVLPSNIIDIQYIDQSIDQYLILKWNNLNQQDLELIIYQVDLYQVNLLYSLIITEILELEVFEKFSQNLLLMKLLSCIQIGDIIIIKLFIIEQDYSCIIQLRLDQKKNLMQLEQQKLIRNQQRLNGSFKINYIDENNLILQEIPGNWFLFYDLRGNRTFYDYYHKQTYSIQIKQLNTTHYIFLNSTLLHIGTIGYEIELYNSDKLNYNFELFAQNEISNDTVSLKIQIVKSSLNFRYIVIYIQSICLITIIIYLRYMKQRTIKPKKFKQSYYYN